MHILTINTSTNKCTS